MEPAEADLTLAPGETATLRTTGTFSRGQMMPVPERRCTILLDGVPVTELRHRFEPPLMRRHATVARVRKAPVIDGVINDGEYGGAEPNTGFVDYRGRGYPTHATSFLLAYDDEALYIAVVAAEPAPDSMAGESRPRDGEIWRDDDVELFIDATFDKSTYRQFAVGLAYSVQFDAIGGPEHGEYGDPKWDAEWQSAVAAGDKEVVVEFAIPYEALGVEPPKPGDKWGLNVCRQRVATGEMSAWSIPYANFHQPTHFGIVTFE